MKRIIVSLIFIFAFLGSTMASTINITDIEGHWAKENIVRMLTNENINGYPDKTFKPNNEVTVLEFIKILIDNMNIKLVEDGFTKWPNHYMATAKSFDLNYEFEKKLTRYEAVEIISKLIDLKSVTPSSNKLKDINSKNKSNVLKLIKLNIINGYEDNTFRGDNYLTRAEAVTIILRTIEANQKIIDRKNYKIDSKYTNISREDASSSEIDRIRYEIDKDKIHFYDTGRFSYVEDYTISEKYITNKKLISIIENLVSENSYTAVYYVPSEYIINQVLIKYGEDDNLVNRNMDYFSFTYYEDKLYDLGRIALKDIFSHECYMKITLKKLWNEFYKFEKGDYIDESIKNKLLSTLKIEFGKDAEKVLNYMLEKYEYITKTKDTICEKEVIGKYIINTYKTDATNLEFYFEKI